MGLSAQTVTLNGELVAEDTKQPLPGVAITIMSFTKPVKVARTTTGPDGQFSVNVSPGITYRICSASTGSYADSCHFAKPVEVKADFNMPMVLMSAATGTIVRVRIVDPDGLLLSPQGSFVPPDPLLINIFAKEEVTSTHIPIQLAPSATPNTYEAPVVIPTSMQWYVAMYSARANLFDSNGDAYQSNTPLASPGGYGDGEFLAVFTLRAK